VYGTFLDPELEGSSNFVSQVTSNSTGKAFEVEEVNRILDTNREQIYHARVQLTPSIVRRYFGFGLIAHKQLNAEMNSAGTEINTRLQDDLGAIGGMNFSFFDGRVKIGTSLKIVNRIEVNNPTLSTAGPFDLETIASEGTGISSDIGLVMQAPWQMIPTLGVLVKDVGDTQFDYKDGLRLTATSRPASVKQSVDVGISMFPIHANNFRSVWSIEYRDATNSRLDTNAKKRLHVGVETNWRDILFFRAGLHQNYWTAGFEIASERVSWQVATYGEEIGGDIVDGVESGSREDRRLNMKLSVRF
jgi:prepilin-type processing-associated H-X9-DG protein